MNKLRCYVSNDLEGQTHTVNVVITNKDDVLDFDLMEVPKEVVLKSYVHHITLGAKLMLQAVDIQGEYHYETFFQRTYND